VALNVVVLVGGVGGAKLAHGLAQILPFEQLTIVVNTGDDFWHYGLRVCPDSDTVMYTLSGLVDKSNGWGVAGDTTITLQALQRYGETPWFRLGDQDIATHLLRTTWLREGLTQTQITQRLTSALGIQLRLLPMTDTPVATILDTVEYGELDFQTYFVRYRWQPTVKSMRFDGIEGAEMTPEVRQAIENAGVILIAPSNPWLSDIPRVAITPIIGGKAVKGPAAKLMAELGYKASAETVANYYGDIINGYVYDSADAELDISRHRSIAMNTLMNTDADRAALAENVLNWIKDWK
jgi:LPPG:FO 2-phospho-L-lactate transferase